MYINVCLHRLVCTHKCVCIGLVCMPNLLYCAACPSLLPSLTMSEIVGESDTH